MTVGSDQPVVKILRAVLLGLLVVFLGVVSALFVARQGARLPSPEAGEGEPADSLIDLASAGEGFDYEVTEGDEQLFHIRADRVLTSRDDLYELQQVTVEVAGRSGLTYSVEAARALYQDRGHERLTQLEGGAVVRSTSGAEIESEGFELRRRGKLVTSTAPVRVRLLGELTGGARQFDAYLEKDRFQLSGDVRIEGIAPGAGLTLSCSRLVYEESDRLIVAEGDVALARGADIVRAGRLSVKLDPDGSAVRSVRARWDVEGRQALAGDLGEQLAFSAHKVTLQYDGDSGRLASGEFESAPGETVVFTSTDATGLARRLVAPYVVADLEGGRPNRVDAYGPVEIREYLAFSPQTVLLHGCAQSAVAGFTAGQLATLDLRSRVSLHRPQLQVVGDRVLLERGADSVAVTGGPAEVHSSRGRLFAPSIGYRAAMEQLWASGGVRAELLSGSGFSMMRDPSSPSAPLQVDSNEASWVADRGEFAFTGKVRAWQEEDFVVADELRGEEDGDVLNARGSVKTVLAPRDGENGSPIEITSDAMSFRRSERVVRYSGSPIARQAGRSLRCDDLEVFLSDASELERLLCVGSVLIDDPRAARSVRGETAEYLPDKARLEITGRPAVLKDADGNEVRGAVVVYDLDAGTARVGSRSTLRSLEEATVD